MNTPIRNFHFRRVGVATHACLAALLVGWIPVAAQTASPAAAPVPNRRQNVPAPQTSPRPATPPSDDVTVLSPFEVTASNNDIGYYAENTLAGSRLSTNIGDLAASISVVTRQQMLDTASIDMNDVFL